MAENMTDMKAIIKFFSEGKHGRKIELNEMKALSKEDRAELGELARKAMGE